MRRNVRYIRTSCMLSYKLDALLTYSVYTSSPSSSPSVTPPTVLPTSWKFNVSYSLVNAYMDSQKLDAILCKPCSYCGSAYFCPKMASEAISEHLISKNFPGGACPPHPLSLACLCMHTYIQTYTCMYGCMSM